MSDSTPLFIVTDAGLAAASVATPVGPFIHITDFRIGSAWGYTPLPTDTGLNGNLLYEGAPSSYRYAGDNTINIVCKIPADAGPFTFGEVALYLEDGTMFAKAVFDHMETKYSSLGTNVLSTYTFNCLLKLQQSVAIFKVGNTMDTEPPAVWEVDLWSDVYPPSLSANPEIPTILVGELDSNGNSSFIHRADSDHWTIGTNYTLVKQVTLTGATVDYVDIAQSDLDPTVLSALSGKFVVALEDGYIRSVNNITSVSSNYRLTFNPEPLFDAPLTGSTALLYVNSQITTLTLTGDMNGSAILFGNQVTLNATIANQAIQGRVANFSTPGPFAFTVPDNVTTLYLSGCAAGGGGGGAGGGYPSGPTPYDYIGGGGGGSGAAGESIDSMAISVTPGQVITGIIGAGGVGGTGALVNVSGNDGTAGGNTTFGAVTLIGGAAGEGGKGPSGSTAGGPGGLPNGNFGNDGNLGGSGGPGVSGPYGIGGGAGRAATESDASVLDGRDATGFGSSGGGGAGIYFDVNSGPAGNGGDGAGGFLRVEW